MTSSPDPPGTRPAPGGVGLKDVAKHAGVSVTTVSNVLNGTNRISTTTRERVLASVRELGYVRNAAAQQLRTGTSATVGIIVPDGSNPFYSGVIRGAEDAAAVRAKCCQVHVVSSGKLCNESARGKGDGNRLLEWDGAVGLHPPRPD